MKRCPNCQAEVRSDERFCGNCGARLEPSQPAVPNQPPQRTGRETVVLSIPDDLSTTPPAQSPPADATLIAGTPAQPSPTQDAPQYNPPTSGQPYSPSNTPNAYSGGGVPIVPQPVQQSGSSVWKIIGIIAGIGVLACVVLAVGVYFFVVRPIARTTDNTLATVNAGLSDNTMATINAGLETAVTLPTLGSILNGEEDATDEPVATPVADAGGDILFEDSFDSESDSSFSAQETDSASYKFAKGGYSMTVKKPKLIVWKTIKGDYADASISVDATLQGNKAAAVGLIFHYVDDQNFYIYTVDDEGRYELDVYKNDEFITLVDLAESSAINTIGKVNTLRVDTVGDTIRLYANDTLLEELTDDTISSGRSAIAVNTFDDPNVTAVFDNLVVRKAE